MRTRDFSNGVIAFQAFTLGALAIGTASIVNDCGYPIYYARVGQSQSADMELLQGTYQESYSQLGVGISIKLAPNQTLQGPISQFELSWSDGNINYDLSNINGSPFWSGGIRIDPSISDDPNYPSCVPIDCPAGVAVCSEAYNQPNENRTSVCDDNVSLTLTTCSGRPEKRSFKPPRHKHAVHFHSHY